MPEKTAAYISQNDLHVGEMTVRETLDFSAQCQGVGTRYGQFPTKKIEFSILLSQKHLLLLADS